MGGVGGAGHDAVFVLWDSGGAGGQTDGWKRDTGGNLYLVAGVIGGNSGNSGGAGCGEQLSCPEEEEEEKRREVERAQSVDADVSGCLRKCLRQHRRILLFSALPI